MATITDKELANIQETLEELKMQNVRILQIMESDDKTKQKGLVETVQENSKLLSELLTREKVYKAKATTWGIIGGGLSAALLWVIKFVIAKIFV